MHVQLTVVVVVISSVTTFSVSTTEMYPRRLAMAKAVLPFWREQRGGERWERGRIVMWANEITLHAAWASISIQNKAQPRKITAFYRYIWLCLCNFFKTIAPIAMVTQHTYICQPFQILQRCMVKPFRAHISLCSLACLHKSGGGYFAEILFQRVKSIFTFYSFTPSWSCYTLTRYNCLSGEYKITAEMFTYTPIPPHNKNVLPLKVHKS